MTSATKKTRERATSDAGSDQRVDALVKILQRRARRLLRVASLGAATTEDAIDALLPLFSDVARGVATDDDQAHEN